MTKRKYIIFDMDDVVAKMREPMSEYFINASGIDLKHDDWHSLDCKELYGVDFNADDMISHKLIERCEPEEGAKETFDSLREMGFTIAVATARGWHPRGAELTEEWLATHGLHQDEIHVVGLDGVGKVDVFSNVSQRGRIAGFIDDQDKYLSQSHNHYAVEMTYAMNRPWNVNATSFNKRVSTLKEFAGHVFEHERSVRRFNYKYSAPSFKVS